MKSLYKIIGLCCALLSITTTSIYATSLSQTTPLQYGLGDLAIIQNTTLLPPESTATENIFPNYVFVDPSTEAIIIQPHPHTFTKEAKTFKSHRLHYIAFWGLFFLMRGTQWGA